MNFAVSGDSEIYLILHPLEHVHKNLLTNFLKIHQVPNFRTRVGAFFRKLRSVNPDLIGQAQKWRFDQNLLGPRFPLIHFYRQLKPRKSIDAGPRVR